MSPDQDVPKNIGVKFDQNTVRNSLSQSFYGGVVGWLWGGGYTNIKHGWVSLFWSVRYPQIAPGSDWDSLR